MHQTITELTPGVRIDRGEEFEDWSRPNRRQVKGCSIQPGEGDRDHDRADGVTAAFTVFAPAGARIDPRARIELPGVTGEFILLGEPEVWATGLRNDHVRLRLRRRDG